MSPELVLEFSFSYFAFEGKTLKVHKRWDKLKMQFSYLCIALHSNFKYKPACGAIRSAGVKDMQPSGREPSTTTCAGSVSDVRAESGVGGWPECDNEGANVARSRLKK